MNYREFGWGTVIECFYSRDFPSKLTIRHIGVPRKKASAGFFCIYRFMYQKINRYCLIFLWFCASLLLAMVTRLEKV